MVDLISQYQKIKPEVDKAISDLSGALDKSTGFLGFFKNGLLKVGDTMREVFTANLFERALDAIIAKGQKTVDQLLEIADAPMQTMAFPVREWRSGMRSTK